MAITPPGFNVPTLSPAALLGNRDRDRRSALDGVFNQILSFGLNQQLMEQSQTASLELEEVRQAGRQEEQFAGALASGMLRSTDDLDDALSTLDELERVPGPPGTRFEGVEFVRGADVATAERQAILAQPFRGPLMGREVAEGTTVGDVVGIAGATTAAPGAGAGTIGSGTPSKDRLLGLTKGNAENIRARINSITIPEVRDAAMAALRVAEQDAFFSGLEEQELLDEMSLLTLGQMTEITRREFEMDRADRARIATLRRELGQKHEIVEQSAVGGPSHTRLLTPGERQIMAMAEAGFQSSLSPEAQALVEQLNSRVVPRRTAPKVTAEMLRVSTAAGNSATLETSQFSNWITGRIKGENGEIINREVADMIREQTGGTTAAHIETWATSAQSGPYRGAFALYSMGYERRSEAEELWSTGAVPPFGKSGVYKAFETLDPAFADTPMVNIGDNVPAGAPRTGAQMEEALEAEISQYNTYRQDLEQQFQGLDAGTVAGLRASLLGDDPEEIAQSMEITARALRSGAQNDRLSSEDRTRNAALAEYYEQLIGLTQDPQRFMLWRDSIFLPAVGRITGN